MAGQTVDMGRVREIIRSVLPAVSGMAAGAPAPVGGDGDSEVVEKVPFPKVRILLMFLHERTGAFPQPVGRVEDLVGGILVTGNTCLGHGNAVWIRPLHGLPMIRYRMSGRRARPPQKNGQKAEGKQGFCGFHLTTSVLPLRDRFKIQERPEIADASG